VAPLLAQFELAARAAKERVMLAKDGPLLVPNLKRKVTRFARIIQPEFCFEIPHVPSA
jgi:hypothetical protein